MGILRDIRVPQDGFRLPVKQVVRPQQLWRIRDGGRSARIDLRHQLLAETVLIQEAPELQNRRLVQAAPQTVAGRYFFSRELPGEWGMVSSSTPNP